MKITPGSNASQGENVWNEDTRYDVLITELSVEPGQYGEQLKVVMALEGKPDFTQWVFLGYKLGRAQTGKVSKLRAVCNAVANKREWAEIEWFESDDNTFKCEGDPAIYRLEVGTRLRAKGEWGPNKQGEPRFSFTRFAPAEQQKMSAAAGAALIGGPADVNPEDIPF